MPVANDLVMMLLHMRQPIFPAFPDTHLTEVVSQKTRLDQTIHVQCLLLTERLAIRKLETKKPCLVYFRGFIGSKFVEI